MATQQQEEGVVSLGPNGEIKLLHKRAGSDHVMLWESMADGVVETKFSSIGEVVYRKAEKYPEGKGATHFLKEYADKEKIALKTEPVFSEVVLDKPCPTCGTRAVMIDYRQRRLKSVNDVPVMPIYTCGTCNTRSYHLTDSYLEYLVYNNASLFSGVESQEMSSDRDKFLHELREYIIRIFASKRIVQIK